MNYYNLLKKANALSFKYSIANESDAEENPDDDNFENNLKESQRKLENKIRSSIPILGNILSHKRREVLVILEGAKLSGAKSSREKMAVEGWKATKQIVEKIKSIVVMSEEAPISVLGEGLRDLIKMLVEAKDVKFSYLGEKLDPEKNSKEILSTPYQEFPHIMEAISAISLQRNQNEKRAKEVRCREAREGLVDIANRAGEIYKDILVFIKRNRDAYSMMNLGGEVEDIDMSRSLQHQRTSLSNHDKIDFIHHHGHEYNVWTLQDWQDIFDKRPELLEDMVTVINAINRGKKAKIDDQVKSKLQNLFDERIDKFINLHGKEFKIYSKAQWDDLFADDIPLLTEMMKVVNLVERGEYNQMVSVMKDKIKDKIRGKL